MPASDPKTRHTDPNQRCTCGWRRFREIQSSSEEAVQRYVFFLAGEPEGFGSVPFGDFFGAGLSGGLWGLFDGTKRSCALTVRCENCGRVRQQKTLSQATVFGGYQVGSSFFVVAADIESAGCFAVEFRNGDVTLSVSPKLVLGAPAPILTTETPTGTPTETLPAGAAAANTLLEAKLPAAPVEGPYEVVLVNRCCGYEEVLGTLTLEVDVIVLNPNDADLNGAPELWLRSNWEVQPPSSQPYTGSVKGIPFDKCDGVIEYDARFGYAPDDAFFGFSLGGSGVASQYTLGTGGVLQVNTPGGGNNTVWEKTLPLTTSVDAIYSYACYRVESAPGSGVGEGLNFQGDYSDDVDTDYRGVRWAWRGNGVLAVDLNGASESPWTGVLGYGDSHWQRTAMAASPALSRLFTWHNSEFRDDLTVANDPGVAPLSHELRARFGDFLGSGVVGQLRNFVVSAPRRFMRAWFRAYATVTNPVLRLYVSSDLDGTADTLARFLIRYGAASPYSVPTNIVSQSFSFTARNTVYEIPIQLTGLTAQQPFYFTVEREFDHPDDRTRATCWLMHATVRGA